MVGIKVEFSFSLRFSFNARDAPPIVEGVVANGALYKRDET